MPACRLPTACLPAKAGQRQGFNAGLLSGWVLLSTCLVKRQGTGSTVTNRFRRLIKEIKKAVTVKIDLGVCK
jgi:hypothetical protein